MNFSVIKVFLFGYSYDFSECYEFNEASFLKESKKSSSINGGSPCGYELWMMVQASTDCDLHNFSDSFLVLIS